MQSAIVFYGWLLLNTKNSLIKILLAVLLAGIAFSLIYQQYHNIYDGIAAIIFGGATLLIYSPISKNNLFNNKPFLLGYIMIAISSVIMWYLNNINSLSNHVWMAFMVLSGFTFSWSVFAKSITKNPPFLSAILGFICILGIYYLTIMLKNWINIDYNFQWVVVGVLIPLTARIAGNFRITK
jgi:tryptophan-rich sensory protein